MNPDAPVHLESPPPGAPPKLSVVLATFNRRALLPQAIESILAQDVPPSLYELIVVVDGSTDGTIEYLRSLHPPCAFRIIEQSNKGLNASLNTGVAAARGELIFFMDDDLVLAPSNFRAHLEAHAMADSLVVHGPVFVSPQSIRSLATEWIRDVVVDEIARWEKGWTWPDDANTDPNYSMSRATILACGGFDEKLPWRSHEEMGICLAKMGVRFVYEPRAVCHHLYVKTTEQLLRVQIRSWGKEDAALRRKHPDLRPFSSLALTGDTSFLKRLAIQAAARSPISPDVLIRPLFALVDKLHARPSMRRLGLRLLWKRIALSFLRGAVEAVGWRNLEEEFGKRLPVLMYHHVGPPQSNFNPDLTITTAQFAEQIRFLAGRGYTGIRAADWQAWVEHGTPLPAKPMLLTFDDAFEDLHEHVFPILERYGFGAVTFVVTNCIGKGNIWDQPFGFDTLPCMTAEQIRYWTGKGFEFGAHTRNHPDVTTIDAARLEDELAGSRSDLEQVIGAPVATFAYPYGHFNAAAAACARQHFPLAFTTEDGLNNLRTDRGLLNRNMVYAWDSHLDLVCLVRLGWNPPRSLILALRKRLRPLKRLWERIRPSKSKRLHQI